MKVFLVFIILCYTANRSTAQQNPQKPLLSYAEIDSLMILYYKKKDKAKMIEYAQIGREKAKGQFGTQDSTYAVYTANLGLFFNQVAQYAKALPLVTEAKNIREKVLGKVHPQHLKSLENLAQVYKGMGNFDKSLLLYKECISIEEKALGKEHPAYLSSIKELAVLYKDMGSFDEALKLYTQAIQLVEKTLGKNHIDYAQALNDIAVLYQRMGNYDKALTFYTQAKTITEEVLGKENASYATTLNNLAAINLRKQNYEKALPYFLEAITVYGKVLGENHPHYALSINNLAFLYEKMGNYDKAIPLYIESKNIKEKILGKMHPDFAASINGLANVYQRMGALDKAIDLHIQSIGILSKSLGTAHPKFAQESNDLARTYLKKGNPDKVWEWVLTSIESCSGLRLSSEINSSWVDSLLNAATPSNAHLDELIKSIRVVFDLLDQNPSIQNAHYKQLLVAQLALQLSNKLRNNMSNEADQLRQLERSSFWTKESLLLLNPEKDSEKAFLLADQNKSVLLLEATKSEVNYQIGKLPDSLILKDKEIYKTKSQLEAKLLEKRSVEEKNNLRGQLIQVEQDIDNFALMIKEKYPKYYQLKYQQNEVNINEIQQQLDDETALLEFVIADSVIHVFYIDKQQVQWSKSVVSTRNLTYRIKALHESLSDYQFILKEKEKAYKQYTEQAYWFYQELVEPTLHNKTKIRNLILVTDRELGHLPFETFLVEAAPQTISDYKTLHYLVNDYNISYNYAATMWLENVTAKSPNNNHQILGMAANYPSSVDSAVLARRLSADQSIRELLIPLPAARKEVEALQEEYEGFFAFDNLASEKVLKEKAGNYSIIHLAMHGILDNKKPILSSLAFTEDGDSLENNFWQAHEISKYELNANLVVLSACETGYGKFENGNGIASLARAFMYAGASSLVVSLWQVNDFATAEIMKNLYQNLAKGMKKDKALRQAKLDYIKIAQGNLTHPAFWSPFIQIGNTEAIHIAKKRNLSLWMMGIGTVFFLSIVIFLLNRRKVEVA